MEIEQTVTIPSAQLCAWLTEQGVEVGTNARLSISKGADGESLVVRWGGGEKPKRVRGRRGE